MMGADFARGAYAYSFLFGMWFLEVEAVGKGVKMCCSHCHPQCADLPNGCALHAVGAGLPASMADPRDAGAAARLNPPALETVTVIRPRHHSKFHDMEAGAGGGGGACSDASGAPTAAPGAALSVFVKYGLCAALVVLSASQNLLISATETVRSSLGGCAWILCL